MKNKRTPITIFAILLLSAVFYQIFILASLAMTYPSYNTEADCRSCHAVTVVRHHNLTENGTYKCIDCHVEKRKVENQTYYEVIRDCLVCHQNKNHTDTHHAFVLQGLYVCTDCHTMKFDNNAQQYYPEVIWDCAVCHTTVVGSIINGTIANPTADQMVNSDPK